MRTSKFVGMGLLVLSSLSSVVILLLPLKILQRFNIFQENPQRSLWLFFVGGLIVGLILFALGTEEDTPQTKESRLDRVLRIGGSIFLLLGFLAAIEIFLIEANLFTSTQTASLWWLFVAYIILGGIGTYMTEKSDKGEAQEASDEKKRTENQN